MIRNVSLEEISDGKLYTENDLVRTDTNSCVGCKTVCCQNMGTTIKLDPLDAYELTRGTGATFDKMLGSGMIELNVVDGLVMPNLKMDESSGRCAFLDEENRCKIHGYRPGICRMFPLGRYWEDKENFRYILQKGECNKDGLTKIKVKKWLGIEGLADYDAFVIKWHSFVKDVQEGMAGLPQEQVRVLNTFILKMFFMTTYGECQDVSAFYEEFGKREKEARAKLGLD